MLMLLVRLGLRAGEVRTLSLQDLDWRAGELVVRGKGNRVERLPLPTDVGQALAAYLRRGRPATAQGRAVFVRVRAPHRPLTSGAVTNAVLAAASRAELTAVTAHRLRHTVATQMVCAGVPLPEISQVLRHRRLLTTVAHPYVAALGGSKISDHLGFLKHGLEQGLIDQVLAGGMLGHLLLMIEGVELGEPTRAALRSQDVDATHPDGLLSWLPELDPIYRQFKGRFILPSDVAYVYERGERRELQVSEPDGDARYRRRL